MNIDERITAVKDAFPKPPQIQSSDIPKIDLYMDQLVTYMDDNLSELKRDKEQPFVTKTMVNNYTKTKLLPPANKKKYKPDHIRHLSMIVQLKKLLSMQDIGKITAQVEQDDTLLYDVFLTAQQSAFAKIPETLDAAKDNCTTLGLSDQKTLAAIALQLVADAQSNILVAEHILDMIADKNDESRKKSQ